MLNSAVAVCTCVSARFRLVASTCTFDRILSSIVTKAFSTSLPSDLNNQVFTFNLDQSRLLLKTITVCKSSSASDNRTKPRPWNLNPDFSLTFSIVLRFQNYITNWAFFPAYEHMPRSRSWCFDVIPWCTAFRFQGATLEDHQLEKTYENKNTQSHVISSTWAILKSVVL